jgi:outer membrane protein assembly factor BamD (BamD/ComL family)
VPDAHYYLGVSYWRESRGSPFDQDYTQRAITEFDTFLSLFPAHPRAEEIRTLRRQAEERLARKDFENGRLYLRMNHPGPARFYFQEVQRKYPDSDWAKQAALGEAQCFMKEKQWAEAIGVLERLLAGSPPPDVAPAARKLLEEARRKAGPSATG